MSLTLTQVACGTAGTLLATLQPGAVVTIQSSVATGLGTSSTVGTATGYSLAANVPVTLTVADFDTAGPVTLYGVSGAAGTVSLAISNVP